MMKDRLMRKSLFLLGMCLLPKLGMAAQWTCDGTFVENGKKKSLELRLSFPLPFDPYFDPSLEEDNLNGELAEKIPVVSFPASELGVGTYLARSFQNYDSRILTVFDKPSNGSYRATYTRILTEYPSRDAQYPQNQNAILISMQCKLSRGTAP